MRVAILSDIHANIHALEAVYSHLDREGVQRVLVAGDLVGYYYWPRAVIDLLRRDPRVSCIRGNHERILEECMADPLLAGRHRRKYGSGYDHCLAQFDEEDVRWLRALPDHLELQIAGKSFHVAHGSLASIDEYLYPDVAQDRLVQNYSGCDYTVFGHTHYPLLHTRGNQVLVNPGSVGQPRDHGGAASFVTINLDNGVIQFHRCRYDVSRIEMAARQYDPGLEYLWTIMGR